MIAVTSASRYQSRSSMDNRGLIPRNSMGLAEAVPIGCRRSISDYFCRIVYNSERWFQTFKASYIGTKWKRAMPPNGHDFHGSNSYLEFLRRLLILPILFCILMSVSEEKFFFFFLKKVFVIAISLPSPLTLKIFDGSNLL